MRIVLTPLSHPGMKPIEVRDSVLTIGGREEPFSRYADALKIKLAPRHARIFVENGTAYLISFDAGSKTTVNGHTVGRSPEALRLGDEIRFADELAFRIDITTNSGEETKQLSLASPIELTLTPEHSASGLDIIVVKQFPFVINKAAGVFAQYKDRFPDAVNYLSRRHAYIFAKTGKLYIEDLGSTNGTFVSGDRLGEQVCELLGGSTVAFGREFFVYRVGIARHQIEEKTKLFNLKTTADKKPAVAHTVFIESPSKFLDIYCPQEIAGEAPDGATEGRTSKDQLEVNPGISTKQGTMSKPSVSLFARWLMRFLPARTIELFETLRQLRRTSLRTNGSKRIVWWGVAGTLGAALAGYAIYWYSGSTEREIRSLLDANQYQQAAVITNKELASRPEDEDLRTFGTEALLRYLVPVWMELIGKKAFAEAGATLAAAKSLTSHNRDGAEALETLRWLTELEKFLEDRGSADAMVIYRDEEVINNLLDRWERDEKAYREKLATIAGYQPQFEPVRVLAFSQLRALRNKKDVYLAAIEAFNRLLEEKLKTGSLDEAGRVIGDFSKKYRTIGGTEDLESDLARYSQLTKAIEKKDLGRVNEYLTGSKFQTPPFRKQVAELKQTDFPPPDVLEAYARSAKAWRAGDVNRALDLLENLVVQPWGEVAKARIAHYSTVAREFAVIKPPRKLPKEEYTSRLITFFGLIDREEDAFFARSLEEQFRLHRDEAVAKADAVFTIAHERWAGYLNNGGIRGILRLEGSISDAYRTQARLLSEAYENASRGRRVYQSLKEQIPEAWARLHADVTNELKVQRHQLSELRTVIEATLLEEKLRLLAPIEEPDA